MTLERFFRVPIHHVSPSLLAMAEAGYMPEWMRGVIDSHDLPRFDVTANEHQFFIRLVDNTGLGERVVWIVENLTGPWSIDYRYLGFSDLFDAACYRLRFDDAMKGC